MKRLTVFLVGLGLAACGSVNVSIPDDIGADFDPEQTLKELRDCDALSETFVAVVREAAEDLDQVAAASGGRVPAADLTVKVDAIANAAYFDIAERLGCNMVTQRLDTIDRLRGLSPDSEAGTDLVTEIIRELEQAEG